MKQIKIILAILFTFLLIISGCNKAVPPTATEDILKENVKLYYADEMNERLVSEEREISYKNGEDKYKIILEELIKGPVDTNLKTNINKGTKVLGTEKQNNNLIVNLSDEFNQFAGSLAEIMAVGSIVNTMAELDNINKVKILIEGNELIGSSGQPRGFMEPFVNPTTEEVRSVILYFGNEDATAVKGEIRELTVPADISNEDFVKMILAELIKGSANPDLFPTIPKEVKVLSVTFKGKTAEIDFSEEMHTKHWHGAAGEAMTINSIVNTLTEFNYIELVQMTVAGEPMNIEHAILDEPIGRNEDMIER